jgi:hypothetical protein
MRTEDERRRGSVRRQRLDEPARGVLRIAGVGHPRLLGQRHFGQPVEQRAAEAADDTELRKMNMRVDEARKDETAAPIRRRHTGIRRSDVVEVSAGDDSTVSNQQTAVLVADERLRIRRVKDRGA